MNQESIEKAPCNQCFHDTDHSELFSMTPVLYEENVDGCILHGSITYALLQCLGCKSITLKRFEFYSEWTDGIDYYPDVQYYPDRFLRRPPHWQKYLSQDMSELMDEIYRAIDSGSRRLALMGTRTLIDIFCNSRVEKPGKPFKAKLQELLEKEYLTDDEHKKTLEIAIDAGNASAHRNYKPSLESLKKVLDIVENLLELELLNDRRSSLEEEIPKRKK